MPRIKNEYEIKVIMAVDHQHNNDGEDSDDRWAYRGTTSASLISLRASVGDWKGEFWHSREEIPANFPPEAGKFVYIVLVHYDTGDTFGSDGRIEPVAAFETAEKADIMVRMIEVNEQERGFDNIEFENVSIYPGAWKGYFEHINYVENRLVLLEP